MTKEFLSFFLSDVICLSLETTTNNSQFMCIKIDFNLTGQCLLIASLNTFILLRGVVESIYFKKKRNLSGTKFTSCICEDKTSEKIKVA